MFTYVPECEQSTARVWWPGRLALSFYHLGLGTDLRSSGLVQMSYPLNHLPSPCSTFLRDTQDSCFQRYGLFVAIKIQIESYCVCMSLVSESGGQWRLLLPSCGCQGLTSGCQASTANPFTAKPSHQPIFSFLYYFFARVCLCV